MGNAGTPDAEEILNVLAPGDALSILKSLAASDHELAKRIASTARLRLDELDSDTVSEAIYEGMECLDVAEIWARAGRTSEGYVEPHEAAARMMTGVLAPYIDKLRQCQTLGMPEAANRVCMGMLAGLYRFEQESRCEFKQWTPDEPLVCAETVLTEWQSGAVRPSDYDLVGDFIRRHLVNWVPSLIGR